MSSVILPPSPNWYASHLADVAGGLHAFCAHNSIVVADAHDAQVRDVLRGHANRTTAVAFVADDTNLWIVSAAADKSLRLWTRVDAHRGTFSCRRALGKRPAEVRAIAAATGTAVAVLGDAAGNLFVWQVASAPERALRIESCKRPAAVTCLACSPRPNDPLVAVGCANGEVAIVDWEQETVLCVLRHHTAEVQCLRWACLAIENVAPETTESPQTRTSVYLLLSAAPGERLRVYEAGAAPGAAAVCTGETEASLGDGRDVSLVSTLAPPSSPANLAQGQRQRLWLSADWVPAPVVRRASGVTDAWLVTTGYGGGLLARRVPLVLASAAGDVWQAPADPSGRPIIRLPGGHSRTVFSVRCILDFSHIEPGVRLFTIGMDRAAAAWWAPSPRLDPTTFLEAAGDEEALEELEKKAWQRTEREALLVGLGAFPHALAIHPHVLLPTPATGGPQPPQPRLLVGCGDASIKVLPLRVAGLEGSSASGALGVHTPGDDGITLWQGIPAAVTAVIWHPYMSDVAAFGCADGSLGLAHFSRGTILLAPAKHKAAISRLAWFPVDLEYYLNKYGCIPDLGGGYNSSDSEFGDDDITGIKHCHLLSMSSDGSIFRWPAWPEDDLLELFPLEPLKRHATPGTGAAVCKELGRPEAVPHLPGMYPTSMAPITASEEPGAVVGLSNGSAQRMVAGGDLFPLPLACSVGSGAVTHLDAGIDAVAALRADGTLSLELPDASFLPATATLPTGADGAATVTCLAVVNDGYVAVGTQEGAITIWKLGLGDDGLGLSSGKLDNVVTLRGHSAPVLALAWLTVHCGAGSGAIEAKTILVSGAEDQTVKAWDIEATIAAAAARRPATAAEAVAEAEEETSVEQGAPRAEVEPHTGAEMPQPRVLVTDGRVTLNFPEHNLRYTLPTRSDAPAVARPSEPAVAKEGAKEDVPPPPPPLLPAQETESPSEAPPAAPASGPSAAPAAAPSGVLKAKKSSTAAAPPSLGSKGLLPPPSSKADSAEAQEALLRPLLALAAEATAWAPGAPADDDGKEGRSASFFEDLGCVIDPVDGAESLRAASAALLAGPAGPPAAAKLKAQRAAAMALWSEDVGTALDVLLKHDALTADFVSAAAAAGHGAWAAAARAYAGVLEERGEPHLAALHLLSVGDPLEAVQLYLRAGMPREAATLAATRLPRMHPAVIEAREAYALHLEGREEWERAAAQYMAAWELDAAMGALARRGTVAANYAAQRLPVLAVAMPNPINYKVLKDLDVLFGETASEPAAQGRAEDGAAPAAPATHRRRYSPAELEAARLQVLAGSGGDAGTLSDRVPSELLR